MGGIGDVFLGSKPKTKTKQLPTLSPEQEQALGQLFGQLNAGDINAAGALVPGLTGGQELSLEALENLALNLVEGGSSVVSQLSSPDGSVSKALESVLSGTATDFEDFFKSNIQDPLLEAFETEIIPTIRRTFGGENFFGGERTRREGEATEDLLTQLTRSRADLGFRAREGAKNRQVQGLSFAPSIASGAITAPALLSEALGLERNVDLQRLAATDSRIAQIIQALGVRPFENVVLNQPGSQGLLHAAISGFAKSVGTGGSF
jgi:hypothetical protein